MGPISRAKPQDDVSSCRTTVSSLRRLLSTHSQSRHAQASARQRIRLEEIWLGRLWLCFGPGTTEYPDMLRQGGYERVSLKCDTGK
jgi:hypothetical protein